MAFTYSSTSSNRDMLRLYIDDTVEDSGPLPGGDNFSDAELEGILEVEGSLYRAQAHCLERLANAWFQHPTFAGDGISVSRSHIGRNFSDEARRLRSKHGYPASAGQLGSDGVIRIDGYNEDLVDTHEVDN
jgi:hypothetical protein